MELDGFILGLSNGATCVAYCAPVLVPYLLGEGRSIRQNSVLTVQFLLGRLLGYLLFAVLAWGINRSILQEVNKPELVIGPAYVVFSLLLIYYGFFKAKTSCATTRMNGFRHKVMKICPASIPMIAGFVTERQVSYRVCSSFLHFSSGPQSFLLPGLLSGYFVVSPPLR
jgi:sulfite exporter TauE/SafE